MDIQTREDLAKLIKKNGVAVELGVAKGDYSWAIHTARPDVNLWLVDRWSDHHDEAEYRSALRRFQGRKNVTILRETFTAAAAYFKPNTFDFIYIDGYAHTGQNGGETLHSWWPKLKSGGVFAGHDYHPCVWPMTVFVVNDFAAKHGLQLQFTKEVSFEGGTVYPSWYLTKP